MKLKLRENADINVVTGISDIIIDSINKKWDNIRDLNSIIVNLNEEGFEDMVPVIESILEDENRNVGKLQQLVELISPTAKSIDDGRQEAIDELDNNEIKVEEMKLDENFSNVPEETTTVVDPVFGKAIEDKEEDEKVIEDALKENEKLAKETIPEEGYTGKKVTSSALKAMHLSESLFDEELDFEDRNEFVHELYRVVFQVVKKWGTKAYWNDSYITLKDVESALDEVSMHLSDDDELNFEENSSVNFKLGEEVENADSPEKSLTESIKYDIAKELLKKFKQGKMPKDWSSSDYIRDLVSKKHITKEEGEELLSESMNEELDTVDDFRYDVKSFISNLTQVYHLLNTHEAKDFDVAASIINTMVYELDKLNNAMQEF